MNKSKVNLAPTAKGIPKPAAAANKSSTSKPSYEPTNPKTAVKRPIPVAAPVK